MKHKCIMCGNEVKPISGKLPQKVTYNSFCKRCSSKIQHVEKWEKTYHASGSSMEPIEYPEEKTLNTAQRVLRISLYRQGIKNWEAYLRNISDAKLFELIYNTIKEGE